MNVLFAIKYLNYNKKEYVQDLFKENSLIDYENERAFVIVIPKIIYPNIFIMVFEVNTFIHYIIINSI